MSPSSTWIGILINDTTIPIDEETHLMCVMARLVNSKIKFFGKGPSVN